jgi:GT2 family glycosyltransferase
MLGIAIVYPVFNGLEFTKNSLNSLYSVHQIDQLDAEFHVVIVDDGSTDGTFDWIKKNYPQVNLLKGNGNLWWSGGINLAINHAIKELNCDYILWWNNDIIAGENYFMNLIYHLKIKNPQIILGSKIFHAQNRETIWSMGGLFDAKTGSKSLIGTAQQDSVDYVKPVECEWLPGMGTVTHKSVYDKVGMLDEKRFPQYHGDSDFTYRSKKAGFTILVFPDLKIYNDTRHSGLRHNGNLKQLYQSLFTIRSNYNIKKDFLFYRKHATSLKAYKVLFDKYFRYIGGFIKWKLLGFSGRVKNQ